MYAMTLRVAGVMTASDGLLTTGPRACSHCRPDVQLHIRDDGDAGA
ncbi:hypothetical protein ABZ725_28775 [Streptomyces sp. NPDC006872]